MKSVEERPIARVATVLRKRLQILDVRRVAPLLALSLVVACQRAEGPAAMIQRAAGGDVTVALEIALTPEQQEHGLMWRNHLDAGTGMLFIFDGPERDRVF